MLSRGSRWWEGFLCGCLVVAAVWSSYPYAEMGFIDDWSYVKTAFEYARTGHFVYNGWATAMLGWQVPWGALFVKLLGYSFTAARISMLPVDLFSVWLFYAILVRLGVERRNAVFGTLTLGLSPLFVPLAASYMTDIGGLFVILLCLYMCVRALSASSDGAALLWMGFAAASNVAGGAVRQIAWLGALVMVPSTAWLLRRRPRALMVGAALWCLSVAGIFACLRWWRAQPYSVPEKIVQGPVTLAMAGHLGAELLKAFLCLLLLLFPLLTAWMPRFRTLRPPSQAAIAALILALAVGAYSLHTRGTLEHRVMPWLGHVIGTESMFPSTGEMLGVRPVTLNLFVRTVLSLIVVAAAAICLLDTLSTRAHASECDPAPESVTWQRTVLLLAPFTLCYVALLIPRALYSFLYDRYLLGVMPTALALLLLLYQRKFRKSLPFWTYAVLGIFSIYAVAATHDWFSLNRARVAAVNEVHASDVPFTRIQGGFDFDGWTQIESARSINYDQISNPAGVYRPYLPDKDLAPACRLNFAQFTPAVRPAYFVVFRPMPCLAQSTFEPVVYRTWLPPFRRAIYVQQRPSSPVP
jgi:hypothetical protein